MAEVTIENLFGKKLEVSDLNRSLLQHFHDNQLDWMHACGGKGRCTTCKVIVMSSPEALSPLTPAEQKYQQQKALRSNERLSCQARVIGDIVVSAPDGYKLPHVRYSD
jgi:2Fe-2S ferredoxin